MFIHVQRKRHEQSCLHCVRVVGLGGSGPGEHSGVCERSGTHLERMFQRGWGTSSLQRVPMKRWVGASRGGCYPSDMKLAMTTGGGLARCLMLRVVLKLESTRWSGVMH